jgi:hypothetical protein
MAAAETSLHRRFLESVEPDQNSYDSHIMELFAYR